jgi:hypothetical protein
VVECDVVEGHAISCCGSFRAPVAVNVESVGVGVPHEAVKRAGVDGSASAVRLDHEHLIGFLGVDVVVFDIVNIWERGLALGRGKEW